MQHKFIFRTIHKFYYYALLVYMMMFAVLFYGYIKTPVLQNYLTNVLLELSIEAVDGMVDETIQALTQESDDLVRSTLLDDEFYQRNERLIQHLQRGKISSVFVLIMRGKHLFYLFDSEGSERGEAFLPQDMQIFIKMKEDKQRKILIQSRVDTVGFTLIKPIIQQGEVRAFILLDYTQRSLDELMQSLNMLTKMVMSIFLMAGVLFLIWGFYWLYQICRRYKKYMIPNTRAYNRRYLQEIYEKINFSDYYVALIDIDFFKRINDLYGEHYGDEVIIRVMREISTFLRDEDIFIQYGGEEFLLFIAKEGMNKTAFRYLMEDIRLMVERLDIALGKDKIHLTVSIGVVLRTEKSGSLEAVIRKADEALYEAKHKGRNRIYSYELSTRKRLYRERLKEMIESGKLLCYYQPIVGLKDKKVHHYEALLRLEDEGEIIYPDKILPDLEESYFYSRIGMRVIEYNVKKLKENPNFRVSINLSSDDLLNESIVDLLVQHADIASRMLIEILENREVDYIKVEEILQQLKALGYEICIDDFGSGYSNLDHLLNLSIDYLKLDGSLIKNIHIDQRAHEIIRTLSSFSYKNNIQVIAEFVENQAIAELLMSFGIEYGQGYLFSKAMPYEHFFGTGLE